MGTNWILEAPPRICQKVIYGNEESEMACWATTAEMITKWKNSNAFFIRPKFEDKLPQSDRDFLVKSHSNPNEPPMTEAEANNKALLSRVGYFDYIDEWLNTWGFRPENYIGKSSWSAEEIVEIMRNKGPLYCIGKFFSGGNSRQVGGQAHAIAVYGYAEGFGGVHYVDPWDGLEKKMNLDEFNNKIEKINKGAIQTRVPNWKDPKKDYQKVWLTPAQTPIFK